MKQQMMNNLTLSYRPFLTNFEVQIPEREATDANGQIVYRPSDIGPAKADYRLSDFASKVTFVRQETTDDE